MGISGHIGLIGATKEALFMLRIIVIYVYRDGAHPTSMGAFEKLATPPTR